MIEINIEEQDKVYKLYTEIKNIILDNKDKSSFNYTHKQHNLYEESEYPGISLNYYNERGSVEFENINSQDILIEINRWHPHKHNGFSGLNSTPCLMAVIFTKNKEEKQILWKLSVESGTMYYKAEVTSLEIPYHLLTQSTTKSIEQVEKNVKETTIERVDEKNPPTETTNLFEELANLQNKHLVAKQKKEETLIERKKEIEKTTKAIMQSYSQKIKQNDAIIDSTRKALNSLDKLICTYSTFDPQLIGNAIQQLITIFEGEEYLYAETQHVSKKVEHGVIDSWEIDVKTKAKIIISASKFKNYYDSFPCHNSLLISNLINSSEVILLSEQDLYTPDNKKIVFYTSKDGQIVNHVNFGRFDYIKDFIDIILQYRFQYDMQEFTENDMLLLMKKFILEHTDQIVKNYASNIKTKNLKLKPLGS